MINTSLDRKYVAKEGGQMNFDPIPEGDYRLRVKEIDPWKSTIKTIKVNKRDENGNVLKNEKGENITETVPNCEFYNCTAKLEVIGGEYNGRVIYHNLTTHPNMDWNIPNFLYALGVPELSAGQIQAYCTGLECLGHVFIDSYNKTVQNKETGIDEIVKKYVNRIKSLKPLNTPNNNNSQNMTNVNLGI